MKGSFEGGGGIIPHVVREKIDLPVPRNAGLHSPRHIVIACDTRQLPESSVTDANRGLMRKATDAIFNFIGYHRVGKPFRSRLRD